MEEMNNSPQQVNKKGDTRGLHPNSLSNLEKGKATQWQKGESGNPQGQSITARQKEMIDKVCPFDTKARTWLDALAEGGMRMALFQARALDNLQDRHEGKVTIPIGGDRENPVYIINVPSEQGKRDIERVMKGDRT